MSNNKFNLSNEKKQIIIGIVAFIVISFIYFAPQLKGYVLNGSDTIHYKGMTKEVVDYKKQTGKETLWTNSMFGGMPTFLSGAKYKGEILKKVTAVYYKIPRPASYLILNFTLFYILLLLLGTNVWVSFVAALAFGMNTAFFVWMDSGHMTKANTLTYIALVVAGVLMAYNKNRWKGGVITAIGLSLMLYANHPQITYYAGLMVLIVVLTYFVYALKEKKFPDFLKTSFVLLFAAILAFGTSYGRLSTTLEYGKYSIRGESDLNHETNNNKTKGLDKSYILEYSYDLGEAVSAFIPRFKGGGMSEPLGENSNFYKELKKSQGAKRAKEISQNAPLYWGTQPISGAPFYYGAVLVFLFVFGLFFVKGKEKWWIAITVIVALFLSLGKNIPALADFMIEYFPGYNKFRDVKNIIVIQQFAMALLGALAIRELIKPSVNKGEVLKALKYSGGIVGGFALLFALIPSLAGDFIGNSDARYLQMGWPESLINALQLDRKSVLRADAFRSFIFVALAAVTLFLYSTKKVKGTYALVIWSLLILVDMWPINTRYLNNEDLVSKRQAENPYKASQADEFILKDKTLDYRVLNISVNPWSDAATSYFHKSIGGYHGAKMQRYQELIEYQLSPELQLIQQRLKQLKSQTDVDHLFDGLNALNMLNTKYLIYNPNAAPIENVQRHGNAWMVDSIVIANTPNDEINWIRNVNTATTAIVNKSFEKEVKQLNNREKGTIELINYTPNVLTYQSNSSTQKLAIFSEIYYPEGWIATINGEEVPVLRANYLLRALVIPAGKHEITFEFKPKTYEIGNRVSLASSILLILAIFGVFYFDFKGRKRE